jgi:hypothetical protein
VLFPAECQFASLTSLDITGSRTRPCVCSAANFPGFSSLKALHSLKLKGFTLEARVLLRLPALQMLQPALQMLQVLQPALQMLQVLQPAVQMLQPALQMLQVLQPAVQDVKRGSTAQAAALLNVLPQLKQLQLLAVECSVTGDWGALSLHRAPA